MNYFMSTQGWGKPFNIGCADKCKNRTLLWPKLGFLIIKVPNIGCVAAHPIPPALQLYTTQ